MDFFEQLATFITDRQEFRFSAKKIGEDLVLTITPDVKGTGKVHHITIPKEDLIPGIDDKIFMEVRTKANTEPAKFQSEVTEGSDKEDEDEEENSESKSKKAKTSTKKKHSPAKKAKVSKSEKKVPAVKAPPVKKEKEIDPKIAEEKQKKSDFENYMKEGKTAFETRKYTEAEEFYKKALDLFPENEKAKTAHANAEKWVKAIANMGK